MKKTILFSILAAAVMITACQNKHDDTCAPLDISIGDIAQIVPTADNVVCRDTAFYDIVDQNGEIAGAVLLSEPYSAEIQGYNGPTPLRIIITEDRRIALVEMLDNEETPRFAERVKRSGLLEKWEGLTVDEALNAEVDAVSGATYTSKAVIESMKTRLTAYQKQVQKETPHEQGFGSRLKKFFGIH